MATSRVAGMRTSIPVVSGLLGVGTIVSTGVWYHFSRRGLAHTREIPRMLQMQMPPLFSHYLPGFLTATLVVGVVLPALALLARGWRAAHQQRRSGAPPPRGCLAAAGASGAAMYVLSVWLAAALGVGMLWLGAGLVTARSTLDASYTLADADPAIHNLIKRASGGLIDPTKDGFVVSVGKPPRDVDIGSTTCGLFCFVLARAMMSDSMDCTCNSAIMAQVSSQATVVYEQDVKPALAAVLVALLCALGLLVAAVGQFAAAKAQRVAAAAAASSPAASEFMAGVETDAAIQVDQGGRGDGSRGSPAEKGVKAVEAVEVV